MRSLLTVAMTLLTAAMLTGMGNLGGTPEGTVPKVEENFKARITDRSGVATDVARFSMEGKLFLEGQRGEGKMNVPFRELKEVSFGPVSGEYVPADLLLSSGARHQLRVQKSLTFFGDTGYGVFQISAGDVSLLVIRGEGKR